MAPRPKPSQIDSDEKDGDEAYRLKRDRNNLAVKKSREKSRQKARETGEKITQLRQENEDLEHQVKNLTNELAMLKNTLLRQVGGSIRKNSQKFSINAGPLELGSAESKLAFADPTTVSRDHEYTGLKCERNVLETNATGHSKHF